MSQTEVIPRAPNAKPAVFEEFFGLGLEESSSPFLSPQARLWAVNLTLKSSLLAASCLVLSFILSFFPTFLPLSHLLLVCVYFFAGIPSLIESIEDLLVLNINIDVLMTLAAFSSVLIGSAMEGGLLLVLFALSGSLEDAVTAKAKDSINQLHRLTPTSASVIDPDGHLIERSLNDINAGTLILVKAGETVPLDGVVVQGATSLSTAHLTGESLPIRKEIGDEIAAGSQNLEGSVTLKVLRTNADSTLTRIINLVTEAQESRPRLQHWFDRLSRSYALTIISLAALFSLTFPFLLNIPFFGIEGSIYRSLAFLIAASPCALIIALPIAYLSAISSCARQGILLKGGTTLDALANCTAIAFDKTGTLTTGELTYSSLEPIGNSTRPLEEVWAIAYTLEQNVIHPIATATMTEARNRKTLPLNFTEFLSIPGYGVQASINGNSVFMGQPDYVVRQYTVTQPALATLLETKIEQLRKKGEVIAVLQINQELYLFGFQDRLRPNLKSSMNSLNKLRGMELLMLTGDHEINAKIIADELGIKKYYANLKPEDKLRYVAELSDSKGLAMVGDGINDAPALARATVGIGMGKIGSGAAIEAADIILLQDSLEKLGWLIAKAKKTQSIVKENLIIAIGAILIASFPALAGLVPLWVAVVMHEGGTVLVGLNALRLLK